MSRFLRTAKEIRAKAVESGAVLVAFSGGKDSLTVLDLCLKYFKRVECFHMEFVPGMAVTRERVTGPLQRMGITCRFYRDPRAIDALRRGIFCDQTPACDRLPRTTEKDVYQQAITDTGISLVVTGKKYSDYRQRSFHMRAGNVFGYHPIREWNKRDVLSYCKTHQIEVPVSHGDAGGIDLTKASLTWLHKFYPDDFQLLLKWFPYAEAVIEKERLRSEAVQACRVSIEEYPPIHD